MAPTRTTIRHLQKRAASGEKFGMLTCYDASMAKWLARAGCDAILVGDTAAQMILGHDSTLPATMELQLMLTAAVRRGAPDAFIMADMPFGSYQCCESEGVRNAIRFLQEAGADCVKLEVGIRHTGLVRKLATAGVPVVAHLGSKPQQVKAEGGYRSAGKTAAAVALLAEEARAMLDAGASLLLLEAVTDEAARQVVTLAHGREPAVPVIGCGAGPACDGHVVVLHDLLGLTDWQPPFAPPAAQLGQAIQKAAGAWLHQVANGGYLADGSPYKAK